MTPTDDDLELWAAFAAKHTVRPPPGACTLTEVVADLRLSRFRLAEDARTYATMQKGMESQAELMDGLKQEVRRLRALAERNYPGLRASEPNVCSAHREPDGHFECGVCYPDWRALCSEHARAKGEVIDERDRLRAAAGDAAAALARSPSSLAQEVAGRLREALGEP